jgi:hypothetical protein
VIGLLLGEAIYQPIWTTGTVDYFLEQTITGIPTELCPKGNQQETIVWKGVSSSSQFSANFVTKQVTAYNASNLYSNLTNSNLVGGHVFTAANNNKIVLKAVQTSYDASSHVITLYYCTNITGTTTVSSRTITITAPEGVSVNTSFYPVMVSRPDLGDTGKLEIWVTTAQGTFTIGEEAEAEDVTGCYVYKLTVEDPTNPGSSDITEEFMGVSPYGIGQYNNNTVGYYLSGFYFADLQNDDASKTDKETPEPVYYLPYIYYRDDSVATHVNSSSWAMGIITDAELTEVSGEYLARTSTSQQANIPVFTDSGILFCRVNSTTMYYVTLSGVISGANLPQTLTKSENDILRLIYEYSLT